MKLYDVLRFISQIKPEHYETCKVCGAKVPSIAVHLFECEGRPDGEQNSL